MRTMGKTENKKNMHENEMKVVSRMKAYQKLAERAISRKLPNRHMISKEGLEKAIAFLRRIIISEPKPGGMFWA